MTNNSKKKVDVLIPHEILEQTAEMSDAQFGELMRALVKYDADGSEPDKESSVRLFFNFLKGKLDSKKQAYDATCELNRKRAQEREQAKRERLEYEIKQQITEQHQVAPNSTEQHQVAPNSTDNDSDYESDSLFVKDINIKKKTNARARGGGNHSDIQDYFDAIALKFRDVLELHKSTEYGITARDIIADLANFCVAAESKGLKFDKRVFTVDELLRIFEGISEEQFCGIVAQIQHRESAHDAAGTECEKIRDRPRYILGAILKMRKEEK